MGMACVMCDSSDEVCVWAWQCDSSSEAWHVWAWLAGGETIRDICRQSGAHVELSRDHSANSLERVFRISGLPEQMQQAMRLISEKAGIVSHARTHAALSCSVASSSESALTAISSKVQSRRLESVDGVRGRVLCKPLPS